MSSLERYLVSMRCRYCKGKGCKHCNYKGSSRKFEKLIREATKGL